MKQMKKFFVLIATVLFAVLTTACGETKVYTVNFVVDGEIYHTLKIEKEEDVVLPKDPTKPYYVFEGWFEDEGVWNLPVTEESLRSKDIEEDFSVYAKWKLAAYTISYHVGEGQNDIQNPEFYNPEEGNFALLDAVRPGYQFEGWYLEDSFQTKIEELNSSIEQNLNLYAKWEIINYSITYHLNEGTNNVNNVGTYNIEGDNIELANPTRNGYNFLGWFLDETFETEVQIIDVNTLANIDLYAHWELQEFKITYNLDGGINHGKNPSVYNILDEEISLFSPTKEHYSFLVWSLDGTFNNLATKIDTSIAQDINLYALWKAIDYDIEYNLDGGENDVSNPNSYTIEDNDIVLKDASKAGYDFLGWYSDEEFNNRVTTIDCSNGYWIVLYAKFGLHNYAITYNCDSDVNNGYNPTSFTKEDDNIVLKPAYKVGYTFAGWYLDNGYTNPITEIDCSCAADVTLYVKFLLETYTINYHLNGGTNNEQNPTEYTFETETIQLRDAERENSTFIGWYIDEAYSTKITAIEKGTAGDLNLYARFEGEKYQIYYMMPEGSINNPQNPMEYEYSQEVKLLPAARPGFTFLYWTCKDKPISSITAGETGSKDLTPVWKATYNILDKIETNTDETEIFLDEYSTSSYNLNIVANKTLIAGETEFMLEVNIGELIIPKSLEEKGGMEISSANISINLELFGSGEISGDFVVRYNLTINSIVMPCNTDIHINVNSNLGYVRSVDSNAQIHNVSVYDGYMSQDAIRDKIHGPYTVSVGNVETYNIDWSYKTELSDPVEPFVTTYVVPSSIELIGSNAFTACTALETLYLPASLTKICDDAFIHCTNLTKIHYFGTVDMWTQIDFGNNQLLKNREFYIDNQLVTSIELNAERINSRVFEGYKYLTSISIGQNVRYLSFGPFLECDNLESVFYDGDVAGWLAIEREHQGASPMHCGADLYFNYQLVTNLVIPNGTTTIGIDAFDGCESIESVTIPASLTRIERYAFFRCPNLKRVNYLGTLEQWLQIDFVYGLANPLCNGADLYINDEKVENVVIPESISILKSNAFEGCTSLKTVQFGTHLTNIGSYVFVYVENLPTIFFEGTEEQFMQIEGYDNFSSLDVYYYSATQPETEGNYWYSNNGVPTIWTE